MTVEEKISLRFQFLIRVVRKECKHLNITDQRLFKCVFTVEDAAQLESDPGPGRTGGGFCRQVWASARYTR